MSTHATATRIIPKLTTKDYNNEIYVTNVDPCFYSTKVLVRNRHCTWTTHFRRSTNKLTRWVSRTGTMNFNHEVRSLPGTTATITV